MMKVRPLGTDVGTMNRRPNCNMSRLTFLNHRMPLLVLTLTGSVRKISAPRASLKLLPRTESLLVLMLLTQKTTRLVLLFLRRALLSSRSRLRYMSLLFEVGHRYKHKRTRKLLKFKSIIWFPCRLMKSRPVGMIEKIIYALTHVLMITANVIRVPYAFSLTPRNKLLLSFVVRHRYSTARPVMFALLNVVVASLRSLNIVGKILNIFTPFNNEIVKCMLYRLTRCRKLKWIVGPAFFLKYLVILLIRKLLCRHLTITIRRSWILTVGKRNTFRKSP